MASVARRQTAATASTRASGAVTVVGGKAKPRGRPFQRGRDNVTAQHWAARREWAAQRESEREAAAALLSAQSPVTPALVLTDKEKYAKVDGRTLLALQNRKRQLELEGASDVVCQLAKLFELSPTGVCLALARGEEQSKLTAAERAALERAPKRARGPPPLVSDEAAAAAQAAALTDPRKPFAAAAQALGKAGLVVSRTTLQRVVHRDLSAQTGHGGDWRSRPVEQYAPLSDQLMDMHLAHLEAVKAFLGEPGANGYEAKLKRLFWQDESNFAPGCPSRQGYSCMPKGDENDATQAPGGLWDICSSDDE